jgi:hypothetical protein
MKERILFYCAAVVALVLILAAVPSHATERRDPLIMQDAMQTQAAKPSGSAHATASGKKHAPRSTQKHQGTSASVVKKNSTGSGQNATGAYDSAGNSSAAK